jgi:hypothetical protein
LSPAEHVTVHLPVTGLMPLQLEVSRPTMACPVEVVVGMLGHAHRGSCSLVELVESPNRLRGKPIGRSEPYIRLKLAAFSGHHGHGDCGPAMPAAQKNGPSSYPVSLQTYEPSAFVRVRLSGVWQPILHMPLGLIFWQPSKQSLVHAVLVSDVRPVSLKLMVGHTHTGNVAAAGVGVTVLWAGCNTFSS